MRKVVKATVRTVEGGGEGTQGGEGGRGDTAAKQSSQIKYK